MLVLHKFKKSTGENNAVYMINVVRSSNAKNKYKVNAAYNELLGTMTISSLYPEFLINV